MKRHDHIYLARPGGKKHCHATAVAEPQYAHPARFNKGLASQVIGPGLDVCKNVQIGVVR
jgi:hypothetical protein